MELVEKYKNIPDTEFVPLECNPIGLVRKGDSKQVILGTKTLEGYRKIFYKGRGHMVHRLVYETFSGRLLEESEYVDHISTDRLDNRFINLRSGTHTDSGHSLLRPAGRASCLSSRS